jgi:steroid 5-alpha reductase family enzyme
MPEPTIPAPASPLVRGLARLAAYLSEDFLGGPRPFRMAWVINAQKATTALFVGALMVAYRNSSTAAWVYLALHGTYGLLWLTKHFAFPDRRWERRVTVGGAVMTWLSVLGLYWVIAFLAVSDVLGPRPPPSPALLGAAIALHTFGAALMMAADAQKYFTLRLRPGLIEDGLFARIRHPSYLGEMMLYGAYALLARHWLAWAILLWVWGLVFVPNMRMIDASLSRHPGFAAYRARTGMLLPRLGPARRRAEPSAA